MVKTENSFFEADLEEKILSFHRNIHPLNKVNTLDDRRYFASLIVSEIKEIQNFSEQNNQPPTDQNCLHVDHDAFDPIQLVIQYIREGKTDEACWLLFLYTYIGKHPKFEWNLLRKIYSGMYGNTMWKWENIHNNDEAFRHWLLENLSVISEKAGLGEHHKYSHLDQSKGIAMCRDILEYISWVKESENHFGLLNKATADHPDPTEVFQKLYQSMDAKTSFNKLIKFSYLHLISNLEIFPIEPGHPYLNDFILSKRGAQHLFEGKNRKKIPTDQLNELFIALNTHLELSYGLQVLQKALAKWGKEKFRTERQSFRKYH